MLSVAIFAGDDGLPHIERCLKSLAPLCAEIIFVDTSQSRKISKIVKKYPTKIYHEPWQNNFSYHRTHSFSKCTGKWILQIDADEKLVFENEKSPDMLLRSLNELDRNINAVGLTMKDWRESIKQFTTETDVPRIFRRGKITWRRRVHNEAMYGGETAIFRAAHLVHYGYDLTPEQREKKAVRTISLLKQSLEDDPTDYQSLYYLAQAYGSYKDDADKVIEYGKKYVEHKKDVGDQFQSTIYHSIAWVYFLKKDYINCKQWIDTGLIDNPLDIDLLYDLLRYGMATGNAPIIAMAAQRFVIAFENFPKLRFKDPGKFFFNYNIRSYALALYYLSISHFQSGVDALNKLKQAMPHLEPSIRTEINNKLSDTLNHLNIKGLIDESKIITSINGADSILSSPAKIFTVENLIANAKRS